MRKLLVAWAFLALVACATMGRPGGSFAVECNVPDALVFIDDVLVGRASEWVPPGKRIEPGFHRIEVRHPGYFSHYAEIELAANAGTAVKADLRPLLD